MKQKIENILQELYSANSEMIGKGLPANINNIREEYLANFVRLGFPTKGNEDYRHTPVVELYSKGWGSRFVPFGKESQTPCGNGDCGSCVKVLNGFVEKDYTWTVLCSGVVVGSIRSAFEYMPDLVTEHLNSLAKNDTESLTALNSAFIQDGVFVWVPKGVKVEQPICIEYNYDTDGDSVLNFSRMLVVAEDNSDVKIAVMHKNIAGSFLVNYVKELSVGVGAAVEFTEFSLLQSQSVMFNSSYSTQGADSQLNGVNVWLGGTATRLTSYGDLAASGCENKFYGLYVSEDKQIFDINTYLNHAFPNCNSFQQVKAIAGGESIGSFTGRVYVAQDAQKTDAIQQSKGILVGNKARIYAEPQLEIYADDVKCSHGATVGQLSSEAVYYMRQRGLSEVEARKLLTEGYINDVVMHCTIEHIYNEIVGAIDDISDRLG